MDRSEEFSARGAASQGQEDLAGTSSRDLEIQACHQFHRGRALPRPHPWLRMSASRTGNCQIASSPYIPQVRIIVARRWPAPWPKGIGDSETGHASGCCTIPRPACAMHARIFGHTRLVVNRTPIDHIAISAPRAASLPFLPSRIRHYPGSY